ncbi:MAG: DUF4347 domain-containing protein, partial [Candidatus Electrothrix sp.]
MTAQDNNRLDGQRWKRVFGLFDIIYMLKSICWITGALILTLLPTAAQATVEYLFYDTALPGSAVLAQNLQDDARNGVDLRVVPISRDEDGLHKITQVLASVSIKIDALHIFSHAVPGALLLGNQKIDHATLARPDIRSLLRGTWSTALSKQADILLYGCELAAGEIGFSFIQYLSEMTGADVVASVDLTGHAELGGDWDLEAAVGRIDVTPLKALSYSYVLGTSDISGRVKKDVAGNGTIDDTNDIGIPGVHVYLYRDINGNNLPDNSDVHYATAVTDANGDYAFPDNILTYTRATLPNDTYWLVAEVADVDTVGATLEQTYGGLGAMIDPDSDSSTEGTYGTVAGSAFGGRRMDTYDSFSSTNLDLDAAEHIIRIEVNGGTNTDNDFGFGFIGSLMGGSSEFYIPGHASLIWEMFESIDNDNNLVEGSGTGQGLRMIASVTTSTDNTKIFYDHWENGYNFDPRDPYNTADEVRTVLNGGTPEIFESGGIPAKDRGSNMTDGNGDPIYDFGDRLYITGGPVSVTVTMWPESIGTVLANSWELYPIKPFQTTYEIPGTAFARTGSSAHPYDDLWHIYGVIQATEDGTLVSAEDENGNKFELVTFDSTDGEPQVANPGGAAVTLNRGESLLIGQVNQGETGGTAVGTANDGYKAIITGSKPVQVNYMLGDSHNGLLSESRGITGTPSTLWDNEYYLPMNDGGVYGLEGGAGVNNELYIYNGNPFELTVKIETSTYGTESITVPIDSLLSYSDALGHFLPNSAVYLKSDGGAKFSAFATIDSDTTFDNDATPPVDDTDGKGGDYDWGMSLVPAYILRNEYYLGWAPGGSDYTESQPPYTPTQNFSPAWITPKYDNTIVYVDTNGDGVADNNGGDGFVLNRLQTYNVRASDFGHGNDNSGMHIWATGPLAVAWGQDVTGASASPGMDLGYAVLPLPMDWMDVAMGVIKTTATPTLDFGGVASFSLAIPAWQAVSDVTITDLLPDSWTYVAESTQITFNNDGVKTIWTFADTAAVEPSQANISGRTALTWDVQAAPFNIGDLDPNDYVLIDFQAQTPGSGTPGPVENESTVCAKRDLDDNGSHETTFCSEDSAFVYLTPVSLDKDTTTPRVAAGDKASFTIAIKNENATPITDVTIGDILPSWLSYDTSSVSGDAGCGGSLTEGGTSQKPEWNGIIVAGNSTCTITYTATVALGTPAGIYDSDAWFTAGVPAFGEEPDYVFDYGETGQDPGTIISGGVNQDPEEDEDVEVVARDLVPDKSIIATSDNGSNGF